LQEQALGRSGIQRQGGAQGVGGFDAEAGLGAKAGLRGAGLAYGDGAVRPGMPAALD
jgi:hypothetical protein